MSEAIKARNATKFNPKSDFQNRNDWRAHFGKGKGPTLRGNLNDVVDPTGESVWPNEDLSLLVTLLKNAFGLSTVKRHVCEHKSSSD